MRTFFWLLAEGSGRARFPSRPAVCVSDQRRCGPSARKRL